MDRSMLRSVVPAEPDRILDFLTRRQHLEPHGSIGHALKRAVEEEGICPQASEQAMQWLHVNENQSIGRLRRTELTQLARSIHRFWRQNAPVAS